MNKSKEEVLKEARKLKEQKIKTIETDQIVLKNDSKGTEKDCKKEGHICISCKCSKQKGNTGS